MQAMNLYLTFIQTTIKIFILTPIKAICYALKLLINNLFRSIKANLVLTRKFYLPVIKILLIAQNVCILVVKTSKF